MDIKFIGRKEYLDILNTELSKEKFEHLFIYGMPHVGKSRLLEKWMTDNKDDERFAFVRVDLIKGSECFNRMLEDIKEALDVIVTGSKNVGDCDSIDSDIFEEGSLLDELSDEELIIKIKDHISYIGNTLHKRTVLIIDEFQFVGVKWSDEEKNAGFCFSEEQYISFVKLLLNDSLDMFCVVASRPEISYVIDVYDRKLSPFKTVLLNPFNESDMDELFSYIDEERKIQGLNEILKQQNVNELISQIVYYCGRNPYLLTIMAEELIVKKDVDKALLNKVYKNKKKGADKNIFEGQFYDVAKFMLDEEKSQHNSFSHIIKCYFGTSVDYKDIIRDYIELGYIELSLANSKYNYTDELHNHKYIQNGKEYRYYTMSPAFLDYLFINYLEYVEDLRDLITGLTYCVRDITMLGLKKKFNVTDNSWNDELIKRYVNIFTDQKTNTKKYYYVEKSNNKWKLFYKNSKEEFENRSYIKGLKQNNDTYVEVTNPSINFAYKELNGGKNTEMPVLDPINMADNGNIIITYRDTFESYFGHEYFDKIVSLDNQNGKRNPFEVIRDARNPLSHFSRYSLTPNEKQVAKKVSIEMITNIYRQWCNRFEG